MTELLVKYHTHGPIQSLGDNLDFSGGCSCAPYICICHLHDVDHVSGAGSVWHGSCAHVGRARSVQDSCRISSDTVKDRI